MNGSFEQLCLSLDVVSAPALEKQASIPAVEWHWAGSPSLEAFYCDCSDGGIPHFPEVPALRILKLQIAGGGMLNLSDNPAVESIDLCYSSGLLNIHLPNASRLKELVVGEGVIDLRSITFVHRVLHTNGGELTLTPC